VVGIKIGGKLTSRWKAKGQERVVRRQCHSWTYYLLTWGLIAWVVMVVVGDQYYYKTGTPPNMTDNQVV